MPTMASSKQPTIAIITAQYCEKLAVDAMIENKETYVRYTTVGKDLFPIFLKPYDNCVEVEGEKRGDENWKLADVKSLEDTVIQRHTLKICMIL